jgi:hypothetical protein
LVGLQNPIDAYQSLVCPNSNAPLDFLEKLREKL